MDVKVAFGKYIMLFTSGTDWYGEESLFDTAGGEYTKELNFYKEGFIINGVTLYLFDYIDSKRTLTNDELLSYLKQD